MKSIHSGLPRFLFVSGSRLNSKADTSFIIQSLVARLTHDIVGIIGLLVLIGAIGCASTTTIEKEKESKNAARRTSVQPPPPVEIEANASHVIALVIGHNIWSPGTLKDSGPPAPSGQTLYSFKLKIEAAKKADPTLPRAAQPGMEFEAFSTEPLSSSLVGQRIEAIVILTGDTYALRWIISDAKLTTHPEGTQWDVPVDPSDTKRKFFLRALSDVQLNSGATGIAPAGAPIKAFAELQQATAAQATPIERWVNIGPAPIERPPNSQGGGNPWSGRVADVAVDPSDANHWLIGAAQGGIWETIDAGQTWQPRTDNQGSLAMGAIAFAPSSPNIVYAGTGEFPIQNAGIGLLRSTDGGSSWSHVNTTLAGSGATVLTTGTTFSDIKVHPSNSNTLVIATSSGYGPYGAPLSGTPVGILRSIDGGNSWSLNLHGFASDLEVHPSDFNNQYAGIGHTSLTLDDAFPNGVYRSLDSGQTWSLLTGANAPWTQLSVGTARVEIAISPSNPNVVYVALVALTSPYTVAGIWRSDNAWNPIPQWNAIPLHDSVKNSRQLGYNFEISVHPSNPDTLFFGAVQLWRYAGGTWQRIGDIPTSGAVHADQHAMAWAGNRLVLGNDGGVYSSTDGGGNWTSHNTNLSITQFYFGSIHPWNSNVALGGSQDNGTERWSGTSTWTYIGGGDGMANFFSSTEPDTHYAWSFQGLVIYRTTSAGSSLSRVDLGITDTNRYFIGSFKKCPSNADVVLVANTSNLWKTTDFFASAPVQPTWAINGPPSATAFSADGFAFAPWDSTCQTYAVGAVRQTAYMWLTRDGGATWANLDPIGSVGRPDALAFHPTDTNTLYAAISNRLFKTGDALSTTPNWTNISPAIPANVYIRVVVLDPLDPDILYVGTSLGLWRSTDAGLSWVFFGPETGLPYIDVRDIDTNPNGRVIAFTYGRSAFALHRQRPDLKTTAVSGPSTGQSGNTITLSYTVCNKSTIAAGASNVGFYLSQDNSVTTSDALIGTATLAGIAGDTCASATQSVTIPDIAGTYYIGAIADYDDQVTEEIELENSHAGNIITITSSADLLMTSVSGPNSSSLGAQITVSNTVLNQGMGSASPFEVGLYLSAGTVINADQDRLIGARMVGNLPSGTSSDENTVVNISSDLAPGDYYIGAIADYKNAITEQNEINNAVAGNIIRISNTQADLALDMSVSPDPATAGADLNYTLILTNNGPQTATGIILTDTLPSELDTAGVTSYPPAPCSMTDVVLTCNIDSLAVGANHYVVITAATRQPGTLTNTASVSAATSDPVASNNSVSRVTVVNGAQPSADLAVFVHPSVSPFSGGGAWVWHWIGVTNWGPSPAPDVTMTETIASTGSFLLYNGYVATPPNWSCAVTGSQLSCNRASPLPANQTDWIGQWIYIGSGNSGSQLTGTATVTTSATDGYSPNDISIGQVTIP